MASDDLQRLTALYAITAQLTSLRDPDRLLQDVATRARELLGVDMAYLALDEGDGTLTIKVAAGSMGSALRGFRLKADIGIAGRVMTEGRPFWTADYQRGSGFTRSAEADAIAREEALGGLLGVPLRVRDDIIGVLFASEREVRAFGDDEVALLASLADFAATAISNARLYESQRETAEALAAANAQLQARVEGINRAAALHERLTGIVVRGGGVAEIVAAVSEAIGTRVDFVERTSANFASGAGWPQTPETRVVNATGVAAETVAPVTAGDEVLACLVAARDLSQNDADLRQLERAALVTALVLVRERALVEAEQRARRELVEALITGAGGPDVLRRRALAAGLDPGSAHVVVVAASRPGAEGAAVELGEAAAVRFGGLVAERDGQTVAVLGTGDAETVVGWCRHHLADARATAGVAASGPGIEQLADAYAEARRSLAALLTLDREGTASSPAGLGIYRFLLAPGGPAEAAAFVERTVGPLLRADEEKGSALAPTLEAYLASGRHHAATAAALFIHPNTLYQRLARIASILGDDWKDPDRCLEVQMALRLRRLSTDV